MKWTGRVADEWLDGLGHMNMRYYLHVFTDAADAAFFEQFYSPAALATGFSAVTAELHLVYANEAGAGQAFEVTTSIVALSEKKIQLYQEMRSLDGDTLFATAEQMWLHVNLGLSKVVPFSPLIYQTLSAWLQTSELPVDAKLGRSITMVKQATVSLHGSLT
jgi:acyl-CoA thioester hydrolase